MAGNLDWICLRFSIDGLRLGNSSFLISILPAMVEAFAICKDAPLMEISSSFIRQAIKDKKDVSCLLSPAVWQYISEMHFYEK